MTKTYDEYDTSMKRIKRWMACLETKGKCITLGRFKTQEEAALCYNKHAKVVWGEFARLNKVGGNYSQ